MTRMLVEVGGNTLPGISLAKSCEKTVGEPNYAEIIYTESREFIECSVIIRLPQEVRKPVRLGSYHIDQVAIREVSTTPIVKGWQVYTTS